MSRLDQPVAGLDVGGTTTRGVICAADGVRLASVRVATSTGGADRLVSSVVGALTTLARSAGVEPGELGAAGIGVPGVVDPRTRQVRHAINLGVGDAPVALAARVSTAFGAPVVVDNDANAAALGAVAVLDTHDDLAYLSIGTGIAVGLVLNETLRRGWRGAAGEIGHLPVDSEGPVCDCGQRGCLEVVASGAALSRRWPVPDGESPATALFAAAAAGSPAAVAERDRFAEHLARAVAIIGLAVDPAVVVLGGGVADVGPPLLDTVQRALRRATEGSSLLADLDLAGRLVILPAGVNAGVVGAVELARSAVGATRRAATA